MIHGLGRTARCFRSLRRQVERAGYRTWARTYPSMRMNTEKSAEWVRDRILADCPPGPLIGITHSMGAIIARRLSASLPWDGVVMLAPPNKGCRLARAVKNRGNLALSLFAGPAGHELAEPGDWPDPPGPCGVIAGTKPGLPERAHVWAGRRLGVFSDDVQHDGTVCVDETRHESMSAFATVHAGHTFLMDDAATQSLVVRFLNRREF